MKSREQNVPLLLWISTAILAHIATGGGAEQIARVIEDRSELHDFASGIRGRLQPPQAIEVGFVSVPEKAEPPIDAPLDPSADPQADTPKAEKKTKKPAPKPQPEAKIEKKIVLPMIAAAPPPPTEAQPPPQVDHRIAVKQHATPDQEDNPTAHFVADEANHVKEESVAQFTSHDQDDPNPTPGTSHAGPQGRPGNSDHEKIGESDEHPGDPTHAPGESGKTAEIEHMQRAAEGKGEKSAAAGLEPSPKLAGAREPAPRETPPAAPAPPVGGAGPAAPDAIASENGYHLDPARPGAAGESVLPGPGPGRLPPKPVPNSPIGMLGLGGSPTPSGVQLNLTPEAVVAVVGQNRLTKERLADGERRKSAHRGSWQNSSFERWRAAIENYVSTVKPGNQTALNAARSPFATYLNSIHNRIHPIFAEDFLGSLDGLPANHALNEPTLITHLEIVLDRDDGHVVKMGVVRTSGITAFDIAALDSVQRASPFGKPPKAIVSPDGKVYFHWEFHRDPIYACSTMNARPYLINVPPPAEPTEPKNPTPPFPGVDPREQQAPPPGSRQGLVPRPVPLGARDRATG